jgi:hypothetical protein
MQWKSMFLAAAAAVLAMGCSAESEPEVEVGDQMPSLAWEGYVNDAATGLASEQPFGDYSSATLQSSGKRYALIHLSESF